MAAKRQNPAAVQKARVGNYIADVDTSGMDPEMKRTMNVGQPAKKLGFMDMLKSVIVNRRGNPKPVAKKKY